MHKFYAEALTKAVAAMRAGGGQIDITGHPVMVKSAQRLIEARAKMRGFHAEIDGPTVTLTPSPHGAQRRGAKKSDTRIQIEALQPGQYLPLDISDPSDAARIRNTVQAVRRAHPEREFSTATTNKGSVVLVRRIDGIAHDERAKQDHKLWPFGRLEVGQAELVKSTNVWSARSVAHYHSQRHGKAFRVEKTPDGILITRTL